MYKGRLRKRSADSVFKQTLNSKQKQKQFKKMAEKVQGLKVKPVEQPELAQHDCKDLDLAFVMDCTSSMSCYIQQAKDNIRKIVEEIVSSEKSDVRLALVEYRDHPPEDTTFVTRCHDFTDSVRTMTTWLSNCHAHGGGDEPEAVADALHDLLKLDWREGATKIGVCISDAPPHGLGCHGSDRFPNGCPDGIDPVAVAHELAQKGITLYVVGCEPSITPYKDFFMALAHITGGQYVSLTRAELLSAVIVGGAREEISLNQLMAEVDTELQQCVDRGEEINEDMMSAQLQQRWSARGECAPQLQNNNTPLQSIHSSPKAKMYSKLNTLSAVRASFKPFEALQSATSSAAGFFGSLFRGWSGGGSTSGSTFGQAPEADNYACASAPISFAQSSRMVSKSMKKNMKKK